MKLASSNGGTFRGTTLAVDGTPVHRFLGIPYAQPPSGDLRFHPPAALPGWTGEVDATGYGPAAPQNPDAADPGEAPLAWSEDGCLNLNVWTPDTGGPARPVMVWIHGGAYVTGANSDGMYDGARLAAATDTVVVAINYRLGALGFLHLAHLLGEGFGDSSNLGLLDQLEALRWVRDNIAGFGGDPHNVTLFGESAGAAAIGTLLGMPASEGLFRRAIMQSGTAERFRTPEVSARVTAEFLRLCGLDESTAGEMAALPAERLLAAQQRMQERIAAENYAVPLPFQPAVGTPSLPEPPLDAVRNGLNSGVDLLVGTNLNEGSFAVEMRPDLPDDPGYPDRAAAVLSAGGLPGDCAPEYAEALAGVLKREPRGKELLEAAIADSVYRQPSNNLLDARLRPAGSAGHGGTFAYLFTWPSPAMGGKLGSCHTLDIPFVFRHLDSPDAAYLTRGKAPQALSDAMSGAWAAFARNGTPAQPGLAWPEYGQRRHTMVLNDPPRLEADPRSGIRMFFAANQVRQQPVS
ncbi:Carboxylesterase type B [Pseudarthrobacter chlorophenolicus A6]|uniref:Carboxylic ester hydrolase n=1 Tax=Pseudarthrobacter chlorophenolicus (strain ATCC 700700 / DSM 12829 / CIP 107037 / JCM 12360 / KCTC 9906 / NCIMB 13794 / A6) TaxID=452863 RepID=B8HAF3_PSECP|nr:carboxylesterase/lipase family protein [Pseudarthrobacter chlorophenolicus]ACL38414.1 Carboxylesterase type B [Pseudarthrobacter chlorophenolicus A6]SDQ49278.1 para-nitrobenzyl esterase [Pseudarthrobacter chlorophenolicus]